MDDLICSMPEHCRVLVLQLQSKITTIHDKWLPAGSASFAHNEDIEHFRAELQSILEIASSLQQLQA